MKTSQTIDSIPAAPARASFQAGTPAPAGATNPGGTLCQAHQNSQKIATKKLPVSPARAAAMLGVTPTTLRAWAMSGRIPREAVVPTLGGQFRYRAEMLEALAVQRMTDITAVARMRAAK